MLIGLASLVGAYLAAVGPLRDRFPAAVPAPHEQVWTFLLGILALFFAFVSPIHRLGDNYLFSVHVVQYVLITLVAPPLLLIGTPRWLLGLLVRSPVAFSIGRALTNPLVTLLLFTSTLAAWHLPAVYELTVHNPALHVVRDSSFGITATLAWWPLVSPLDELPRLPIAARLRYLLAESLLWTVSGVVIILAHDILYPTYATAQRVWNFSGTDDQQLGGLIMWLFGTLVFTTMETHSWPFGW